MTDTKKAAPAKESGLENITPGNHSSTSDTPPTLLAAVLAHLIFDGSLNKYEAARKLGDWSLHSTISTLANTYGVTIKRTPEKVPNARQPVARYSITPNARRHARDVLVRLRKPAKQRREVAAA